MNQIVQDNLPSLSSLFDLVSDGVYVIDTHWNYLYVNHKAAEQTGKSRQELPGKNIWELFPEAKDTIIFSEMQRALTERRESHFEVYYPPSHKWFENHCYPADVGLIVLTRDITERKRQEEQRHFQATILANIQESVIVTDLQGSITYWNAGAEYIFGYRASEMLGKTLNLLYPTQDMYVLQADLQRILAGKDYLGEWEGRRKDGTVVWVDIRTTLLRSSGDEPIGFLGLAKDVTRRRQAEALAQQQQETLRISQMRATRLIEANIIGVVVADMNGIIEANDAFLDMVGYTREDLAARSIDWVAMTPPEFLPLDMKGVEELREKGVSTPFEKAYYRKDGSLVPILIGAAVLEQDPMQWVCFILDVSEQKCLEQALRASEDRTRLALKGGGITVYQQDRDLRYTWIYNPSSGYTTEDILGKTDANLMEVEEAAYLTAIKRRVIETGQSYQEVVKATGRAGKRYFALSIEPLRDGNGEIIGVTGTSRDVTEEVELEQRKDNFISMASHELKTPVTSLKGFVQLLARKLERQGVQEPLETLARMDAQVNRIVKLIDELLDATKIQAGRLEYAQEPVDLDSLVQETVELLQASSSTHTLHVTGVTHAVIQGDKDRLGQVFTNLITNAIKYSPRANKVEIRLSSTKKTARVNVRDYGVGIAPSHQKHVFERFYRAYDISDTTFKGLGMGLYIAYNIVKRHEGDLTVKSQEGRGSTFTVTLPLKGD